MASRIQAINASRPRLKLGRTADSDDLVKYIARSTGVNESGVRQVLLELRDALIHFHQDGRAVKLDGLGIYSPSIDLAGTFKVGHRADMALKNGLNIPGAYKGEILNRENIGKTGDELAAMWDAMNPTDVVS